VVALAAFAVAVEEILPSLDGMQLLNIVADSNEKLEFLRVYEDEPGFDFLELSRMPGHSVNVLVAPERLTRFKAVLDEYEFTYSVAVENVKEKVDEEAARQQIAPRIAAGRISFTTFHRYDTVVAYLKQLAAEYSSVSLIQIGTSYEGRAMYAVKISSGGTGKPAILVDAGIHAREWAAPSTVTYMIHQLVENSTNAELYKNVDWYVIPVLNPDGYEYTHTDYRLWRKTRSENRGSRCRGVDGNRNFGHHWMENGASSSPCSDTFAGATAFSEVESQALRDFVLANKDTIKLYLTFHSYGNYFLYPWGFTTDLPDNAQELDDLAHLADDALASVRGTRYTIGSSTNVLYAAAGGSDDWVKAVGGVELSYTLELPGGGNYGFDLPASDIVIVGKETFEAVKVFGDYISTKFGSRK